LAQEKAASGGESQEEFDIQGLASEATEKRHEKLRKQLEANRKKKGKLIDAMEWCLKMAPDLADYEPVMKWESHNITEKQAKVLKRAGVDPRSVTGKGQASKLIDVIFSNQKLTLASDAQRRLMQRMGNPNWEGATADDARQFFASLRK
jgi:hypothetical protein